MEDKEKAERISVTLNGAYPSHSYPILLRQAQQMGLDADELDDRTNALLLELNEIYSEMSQSASTDFDERNAHDNSILNILEGKGGQIFFQNDKDWRYRAEERRWVALNKVSSWRKAEMVDGKPSVSIFHIR